MKVIDARGLSCPEPVVLLRAAMQSGEAAYQILVETTPPGRTPPAMPSTRAIRSRCRKTAANGR